MATMRAPLTGTPKKDGRWQIVVTLTAPDGSKKRKTICKATQRECQEEARKLLYGEGRTAKEDHTISQLIEAFKAERWPELSKGTKRQHSPAYKRIEKYFAKSELRKIDPPMVSRWLKAMDADPKIGGRGIQAYRNVLSVLLGFARDLGWVETNAAKGVRLPKSAKPIERPRLTPADYYAVVENEEDPVLRDLWETLGEGGWRIGEALAMQGSSIVYSLDLWWLKGGSKSEAGKDREVPLPDALAHRLSNREGWLFPAPNEDRPLNYRHVRDLWAAALKKAEVPYTNLHQLRKLAISRWIASGLPDDVVKAWAGHSDIRLTKNVYNRLGKRRILESVQSGLYGGSMAAVKMSGAESHEDRGPLNLD
jgi:integrase